MDEELFSFVYDGRSAARAFPGRAARALILALLAGIRPEPGWEGCAVYQGPSPLEAHTVCIATRGPGAAAVQQRLVEALERQGIAVLAVYEGGPEPSEHYASVAGGRWA